MLTGPWGTTFNNAGTITKSVTASETDFEITFNNSGLVDLQTGELLAFYNGGTIGGTFIAPAVRPRGTWVFNGGDWVSPGAVVNAPLPAVGFAGNSLLLLNDTIVNLDLQLGTLNLGTNFQGGAITNLTLDGMTLAGRNTVTGVFNITGGSLLGPLTIDFGGTLNIGGPLEIDFDNGVTNAGTVNWTGNDITVINDNANNFGSIENAAVGQWLIQCDNQMISEGGGSPVFDNFGQVIKISTTGTTFIQVPMVNGGGVSAVNGTLNLSGGLDPTSGTLGFVLRALDDFGQISIGGMAILGGTLNVMCAQGFVPAISNSFPLISYEQNSGTFSNLDLLRARSGSRIMASRVFSLEVTDINQLTFAVQPVGTNANGTMAPVVVQVMDTKTHLPVGQSGVPITITLSGSGGTGSLNGTFTQLTDATGHATFNDLSVSAAGQFTLTVSGDHQPGHPGDEQSVHRRQRHSPELQREHRGGV